MRHKLLHRTGSSRPRPPALVQTAKRTTRSKIDQVVAEESLRNERKFADVRAAVLVISSLLDVLVFFFPQALLGKAAVSPTIALFSVSACVISIGIVVSLRRPQAWQWLDGLQTVIPFFDALLIALFITNIWRVLGESKPEIITNVAAFCCLLAVSGGIRIRRRASLLTTLLALVNFAYAAVLFRLDTTVSLFCLFTILSTGLVAMLTAGIVRRQGKNAAGRLLMQQFLPESVVEAAFENPNQLLEEPTESEVTIMVTDLRGFTHYSEKLQPLDVLNVLNRLQGNLSAIVEQQGGWVDKFMGDGMLAVFGAPRPLANHAEQALKAAQMILDSAHEWSPLPIGVGLHSGSIVSGCLGTGDRLEFTVIGDTVNVASRLEALTKDVGHPILVSVKTQRQVPTLDLVSLGEVLIRGRDEQLEVFTLAEGRAQGQGQ